MGSEAIRWGTPKKPTSPTTPPKPTIMSETIEVNFKGDLGLSNLFARSTPAYLEGPREPWEFGQTVIDHGRFILSKVAEVRAEGSHTPGPQMTSRLFPSPQFLIPSITQISPLVAPFRKAIIDPSG
jgi:hypothetical protein